LTKVRLQCKRKEGFYRKTGIDHGVRITKDRGNKFKEGGSEGSLHTGRQKKIGGT